MYYIYEARFSGGIPFYVGMSINHRVDKIVSRSHNPEIVSLVEHLCAQGQPHRVEIVYESAIESEALNKKVELISKYGRQDQGRGPLLNKNDGTVAKKEPQKHLNLKINKSDHHRIKSHCWGNDITMKDFIITCVLRHIDQFEFYYTKQHRG